MRIASCSSPRPETLKVSGESVSSTRSDTLLRISRQSRSRSWVEVTNLPSRPANGETLEEKSMATVGSSMCMTGSATGFSGSAMVSPISMASMPATATMSPADGLGHLHALQSLVAVELGDLGVLDRAVALDDRDPVVLPHARPLTMRPMMSRPT